jgi:hypothetical protein
MLNNTNYKNRLSSWSIWYVIWLHVHLLIVYIERKGQPKYACGGKFSNLPLLTKKLIQKIGVVWLIVGMHNDCINAAFVLLIACPRLLLASSNAFLVLAL